MPIVFCNKNYIFICLICGIFVADKPKKTKSYEFNR